MSEFLKLKKKPLHLQDLPKSELHKGQAEEREHTTNPRIATQIASDHLHEDKKYYTHLEHMDKQAFERGFLKAAIDNNVHPLLAAQLLKFAAPGMEGPQMPAAPMPQGPPMPAAPKPPMAGPGGVAMPSPKPSAGKAIGQMLGQPTELNAVKGFADKFKNFNFGQGASNLVAGAKQQLGDMAPGLTQGIKNDRDLYNQIGDLGNFAATNAIPKGMDALNDTMPQAVDSLLKEHGPGMAEATGGLVQSYNNAGSGMTNAANAMQPYIGRGPNDLRPIEKAIDYMSKGPGTNTMNALHEALMKGLGSRPQ